MKQEKKNLFHNCIILLFILETWQYRSKIKWLKYHRVSKDMDGQLTQEFKMVNYGVKVV